MFLRFLLLLAIVPLVELWLLVEMTQRTSLWWTVALVLSTGIIGMSLVRWQGMKALKQIQHSLSARQSPSEVIVSGVLILIAGAFLLTPGIITDTAGFLLLIPPLRMRLARYVQKWLITKAVNGMKGSVWVSSFSANLSPKGSPQPDNNDGERPGVLVIDPNERRLQ